MTPTGPFAAFALGWAGVVPFAGLTIAIAAGWPLPVPAATLLVAYGAAILSFMGGAQWGLTVQAGAGRGRGWPGYAISVLPALVAWAALFLPSGFALPVLAGAFAALLGYDLWTVRKGYAPAWYGRLRGQLSAAVVGLLLVAAAL